MAAPPSATVNNISGKYVMNKTLSGDFEACLTLQGIGWLTRKAICFATITLNITHYTDASSVERIDVSQTLTGGIKGTSEARTLDQQWRSHSDHIFGNVRGRSRRVPVASISADDKEGTGDLKGDAEFLKEGWLEEVSGDEKGAIESYVVNEESGWTAWQIWGFQDVQPEGGRRYVRNVVVRKGEEAKRVKLVYDYIGEADENPKAE